MYIQVELNRYIQTSISKIFNFVPYGIWYRYYISMEFNNFIRKIRKITILARCHDKN
jgi:hypothetical protein